MGQRIKYFDIAKAIGIIAIIYGHLNEYLFLSVMSFHVPIFFVISGYFLSQKRSYKEYACQKARELLIPYFATGVVLIILALVRGIYYGGAGIGCREAVTMLLEVLYGSGSVSLNRPIVVYAVGAIWFLWALFWSLLIVKFAIHRKWSVLYVAGSVLAGMLISRFAWLPLSLLAGMVCAGYVYIGYCAHQYIWKKEIQWSYGKKLVTCVVLLFAWYIYRYHFAGFVGCVSNRYEHGIRDGIGTLVAVTFIIFLSDTVIDHIPVVRDILCWIGRHTLQILCVHMIDLRFFPWDGIVNYVTDHEKAQYILLLICKVTLYSVIVWIWDCLKKKYQSHTDGR